MVLTSAATSLRICCAILVPSRMVAGIRAPGKFYRKCRPETEASSRPPMAVYAGNLRGRSHRPESSSNGLDLPLVFSVSSEPSVVKKRCERHHTPAPAPVVQCNVMIAKDLLEILVCPACK